MVACLLESKLQMIINTMKYINLILEYIKSITEAPEKKRWQGSSHLSRAYDNKMYQPPTLYEKSFKNGNISRY